MNSSCCMGEQYQLPHTPLCNRAKPVSEVNPLRKFCQNIQRNRTRPTEGVKVYDLKNDFLKLSHPTLKDWTPQFYILTPHSIHIEMLEDLSQAK